MVAPVICCICLSFCPESPVWYMTKNRLEEAKAVLTKLRGSEAEDIIKIEFDRILYSVKTLQKEDESEIKMGLWSKIPKTGSFWKPFGFLVVVFNALQWGGLPALGFYMISLLQKSKVPIDSFWAGAIVASHRAIMSIFGSRLIAKYERRTVYLSCCVLFSSGLISLASYLYLNIDDFLIDEYPITRWMPIISIMIIYTAFALGYGSIPFILQVSGFNLLKLK